jgi:hypothetical protein
MFNDGLQSLITIIIKAFAVSLCQASLLAFSMPSWTGDVFENVGIFLTHQEHDFEVTGHSRLSKK